MDEKRLVAKTHAQNLLQRSATFINHATGYTHLQRLKDSVRIAEEHYATTRSAVSALRSQHTDTNTARSQCQRDINALLQRKHSWTPDDVRQFTELYAR
jgi:sensitive to high expression protein 9